MKNKQKVTRVFFQSLGIVLIAIMGFMLFRAAPVAIGAGLIQLDGVFSDWSGQSCVGDPQGDATQPESDVQQFCFATNPGDSNAYFMLQTFPGAKPMTLDFVLHFDINNNGSYGDVVDKTATIRYEPKGNKVSVSVDAWTSVGAWGLIKSEGGTQAEWGIPFSTLGIQTGQPIRMYFESIERKDRVSDGTSEVQWSPANALGWLIIAAILVAGSVYFAIRRRGSEAKE